MTQSTSQQWRLFQRAFGLFLVLGVGPSLLVTIAFAWPNHWAVQQLRTFVGILLIFATISTLCLAGIVVRLLKQPLQDLLEAQRAIQRGELGYRLLPQGSVEMHELFSGFNVMAESVAHTTELERQRAAEQTLTQLVSRIVHDLRSPLTSLEVASRHLETHANSAEERAKVVELMKLGTSRLRDIAEELLQERRSVEAPKTNAVAALQELVQEFRARNHTGLTIEMRSSVVEVLLAVPVVDLQRAVGNLVTNAIEAMCAVGNITIDVLLVPQCVEIHVVDSGPGMSPEILQRVLQGGFTFGKVGGSGIGMTVVRETIDRYGGSLTATSQMGRGTSFVLKFPVGQS